MLRTQIFAAVILYSVIIEATIGDTAKWVSLEPLDQQVRLLTNAIWSTAASKIPTQRVQHLWVQFGGEVELKAIRIEPKVGHREGSYDETNRPRQVIVQTSRDMGASFETLAALDLSGWTEPNAGVWKIGPAKVDNIRIIIPKADKMGFPAYKNAQSIQVLCENAAAAKQFPVMNEKMSFESVSRNSSLPLDRVSMKEDQKEVIFLTPVMKIGFSKDRPGITRLGWDIYNNTHLEEKNLLCETSPAGGFSCLSAERGPSTPRNEYYNFGSGSGDPVSRDGTLMAGRGGEMKVEGNRVTYTNVNLTPSVNCTMSFLVFEEGFEFDIEWRCEEARRVLQAAGLRLPFDMYKAVTNAIAMPNMTGPLGLAELPAVINAPDQGYMEVTQIGGEKAYASVHSMRGLGQVWFDLVVGAKPMECGLLELQQGKYRAKFKFKLKPIFPYVNSGYGAFVRKPLLSVPEEDPMRSGFLRGWLSGLAFRPDIGVFANNSVSDAALLCEGWYAEHVLWTPKLADGLDPAKMLSCTLEQVFNGATFWGMDFEMWPSISGSVGNGVWCYLAKTGDWEWARANHEHILRYARELEKAVSDQDGFMHEKKPGTFDSTSGVSWWDAVSSGGVEAWNNALTYRYLLRTAQVSERLGDGELARKLKADAAKMKTNYVKTLYDPNTGWIANWCDANGRLHNYGFFAHTGAAITCGVIDVNQGKPMLEALWKAMKKSGFRSYQYGLLVNLFPIPRNDYCFGYGAGVEKDGTDSYGIYMNGAVTGGQAYWFVQALYQCGMRKEANELMLGISKGFYECNFAGPLNSGLDWRTWDGRPAGYEGLLVDMYHVLQAVLTGYLEWEYTLDGIKTPDGSGADFLMKTRKCMPDFGKVITNQN